MSLVTPKLLIEPQLCIDATLDFTVTFSVVGGDQVSANTIIITKISDNTVAYNNTTEQEYYSLNHIIPANTLVNGNSYKIQIQTLNSNGIISQISDPIPINCYSTQIIDIENIQDDSIWNNQDLVPQGVYIQNESVPLSYYEYYLYNSNSELLSDSGKLYDGLLTYQFSKLDNNKEYIIEFKTSSKYNVVTSIKRTFTTEYIMPTFSNLLTLSDDYTNAKIDVTIMAIKTTGKIKSGNVIFKNGYADCSSGVIQFDDQINDGLYFKYNYGNWQMQLWLKGLVDNRTVIDGHYEGTLICPIYGDNGVILKLMYFDGTFHILKFINNTLFASYVSDRINATTDNDVYLFINSENDRIGMTTILLPLIITLDESTNQTQTYSTTINNLKSITNITVNTGIVSYTLSENTINLNISGGSPSRNNRDSKVINISETNDSANINSTNITKYITVSKQYTISLYPTSDSAYSVDNKISYSDENDYCGTLNLLEDDTYNQSMSQYEDALASLSTNKNNTITLTFNYGGNVSKANVQFLDSIPYNQDGYSGTLYKKGVPVYSVVSGSNTQSKTVTIQKQYDFTIQNGIIISDLKQSPANISYNDADGYSGILNFVYNDDTYNQSMSQYTDALVQSMGNNTPINLTLFFNYNGIVTKPDNRQYSYIQNYTGIVYGENINYYQYIVKIAYETNN